jgi:hypothetical protein
MSGFSMIVPLGDFGDFVGSCIEKFPNKGVPDDDMMSSVYVISDYSE